MYHSYLCFASVHGTSITIQITVQMATSYALNNYPFLQAVIYIQLSRFLRSILETGAKGRTSRASWGRLLLRSMKPAYSSSLSRCYEGTWQLPHGSRRSVRNKPHPQGRQMIALLWHRQMSLTHNQSLPGELPWFGELKEELGTAQSHFSGPGFPKLSC